MGTVESVLDLAVIELWRPGQRPLVLGWSEIVSAAPVRSIASAQKV